MAAHEEGIIREVGEACQKARLFGCTIHAHIRRWGHTTEVSITPDGTAQVKMDEETLVEAEDSQEKHSL